MVVEIKELLYSASLYEFIELSWKTVFNFLKELKIELLQDFRVPLLFAYENDLKLVF